MKRVYIIVFAGLIALLGLMRILFDFNGLYGQDAFEYYRYAGELNAWWVGGAMPGDFFWPIGYPLIGSLLSLFIPDLSLALQLLSMLSLFGVFVYVTKALKTLYPESNKITAFSALFLFCAPFFLRAGFLCMSDMLAAFFVTACVSHFIFYRALRHPLHFALCIFFGGASCLVRYGSVAIILIPCIAAGIQFSRNFSLKGLLLCLLFCAAVIALQLAFRSEAPLTFTKHTFLSSWSFQNLFRNAWITPDEGMAFFTLYNIFFYFSTLFHPAYFCFALLLLPWMFSGVSRINSLLLLSVSVYLVFLSGIPTQNKRYVILAVPPLVLFLFPAYEKAMEKFRAAAYIRLAIPFGAALLCFLAFRLTFERMQFEKHVLGYLKDQSSHTSIYTFDVEVALRGYALPKKVRSLWTEDYSDFESGALVLVNEKAFSKQWSLHRLMRNWKKLKETRELLPLHSFGKGWELYEIR